MSRTVKTCGPWILLAAIGASGQVPPQPWPRGTVLSQPLPFTWPDSSSEVSLSREQVLSLINQIDPQPDYRPAVDAFRVAELSKDKSYIIATMSDEAFRGSYVIAVYCKEGRCFSDILLDDFDLTKDLVDVDGDGALEIIAARCMASCSGVDRMPVYTYVIYKFLQDKGFTDFSAKAADYYREHLLPLINKQREEVDRKFQDTSLVDRLEARAGADYAYDDYRRRVLGEKDAGVGNAISWVDSVGSRELGLLSLDEIDSPLADQKLQELTKSADPIIAQRAASILREKHPRPVRAEPK